MALKQPNTLCKNRDCHKGEDGGRKHYYTCRYCAHTLNWRSMACCEECYLAYMEQVREAREHGIAINTYPERTDMTHNEVVALVERADPAKVIAETNLELQEELKEQPDAVYGEIVAAINGRSGRQKRKN